MKWSGEAASCDVLVSTRYLECSERSIAVYEGGVKAPHAGDVPGNAILFEDERKGIEIETKSNVGSRP